MWRFWVGSVVALGVCSAGFLPNTRACGPYFPSSIIADEKAVLSAPVASFRQELDAFMPERPAPPFPFIPPQGDYEADTEQADCNDLAAALKAAGKSEEQLNETMEYYVGLRADLAAACKPPDVEWDEATGEYHPLLRPEPVWAISKAIPEEFAGYFRGAIAYRMGRLEEARDHWDQVLKLPPRQRRYRSVWAAYMLGRSWVKDDPARAVTWFQQTRKLAKDGFRDCLGLAASSIGWEARAELNRQHFRQAADLYLVQRNFDEISAIDSLRIVAENILESEEDVMAQAVRDALVRALVMAHLVSYSSSYLSDAPSKILAILETHIKPGSPGAERLAWAAYQRGDMEIAQRWVDQARKNSPITLWIRAKLLLREGEVDAAASILSRLVRISTEAPEFDEVTMDYWDNSKPAQQLRGELATLRLTSDQYTEALRLLIAADYPMDAAYVAERLLTISELMSFVDSTYPGQTLDPDRPDQIEAALLQRGIEQREDSLAALAEAQEAFTYRFLCARRLCRMKRYAEARRYLPPNLQPVLDELLAHQQRGYNTSFSVGDRVASLWAAADLTRWYGWGLLGTAVEPDWYSLHCQYDPTGFFKQRSEEGKPDWIRPNETEISRATESAVEHDLRFHYRYEAARLAWDAADLFPDQSDEAAAILYEAGKWLVKSDPQLAQEFRQAAIDRQATMESPEEYPESDEEDE